MTNNNNEKEITINDKIKVVVDDNENIIKIVTENLNNLIGINIETSEGTFKITDGAFINHHGLITI
jgi:predicted metalloprotease